jgi:ribose 5-phosphate isomerase A
MTTREAKNRAVREALLMLPEQGTIGLGTGSTASLFIDGVAEAIGQGKRLVGVPTSEQSRIQAEKLGIPMLHADGPWEIDLCVDGADEVSEALDLIKGGGGCHLREKIVSHSSRLNVIVVDETKMSHRLGDRRPVPVEVMPFGHGSTARHLSHVGQTALRLREGQPWLTDTGNFIYDLVVGSIEHPASLDLELRGIPGVVETGLFVGRAQVVIVAGESGVRRLYRTAAGQ